jgi:hypothetical protein
MYICQLKKWPYFLAVYRRYLSIDGRRVPLAGILGQNGNPGIYLSSPAKMNAFLDWFNDPDKIDPVLKAAIASSKQLLKVKSTIH